MSNKVFFSILIVVLCALSFVFFNYSDTRRYSYTETTTTAATNQNSNTEEEEPEEEIITNAVPASKTSPTINFKEQTTKNQTTKYKIFKFNKKTTSVSSSTSTKYKISKFTPKTNTSYTNNKKFKFANNSEQTSSDRVIQDDESLICVRWHAANETKKCAGKYFFIVKKGTNITSDLIMEQIEEFNLLSIKNIEVGTLDISATEDKYSYKFEMNIPE